MTATARVLSFATALSTFAALAPAPARAEGRPATDALEEDPWADVRLALRPPAEVAAPSPPAPTDPFERSFGFAAHYARWAGAYDADGVGFRIRWEPDFPLGIDLFAELLDVDVPAGSRVNVPVGFNLYVPWELAAGLRVRALGGLCAQASFTSGGGESAPEAEDIQFGVHLGAGAELALGPQLSLFLDATYQGYWGHGHQVGTWTAAIDDELSRRDNLELGLGLQLHL